MQERTEISSFAVGNGLMARLVREFDWASTPLGPINRWPSELKTVVGFVLESRFPAAIVWGPHLVTIYNDGFRPILGKKPEALGRSFAEVWSEAWDEIGPIATRALAGEATFIEDFPLHIDRRGQMERAWFTFCYSPLRLGDGTIAGMMDTVVETTETVRARAELQTVNRELNHRLKNTMALVQSIASQTLGRITEQKALEAFHARIRAMAHAHDVLVDQHWSGSSLQTLAKEILAPFDGLEQIMIQGPYVQIGSHFSITFSLTLHELATNAAKYGALSKPEGRVILCWRIDGEQLSIQWQETGGPPAAEPRQGGFGTRLIEMAFGSSGAVRRQYLPSGFEAEFQVPLQELRSR